MINKETIDKLKEINDFINFAENFFKKYEKEIGRNVCDKHSAKFDFGDRNVSFTVNGTLRFISYTGYYGNSSVSTFGCTDSRLATEFFLEAINNLKKEIFAEMARAAKKKAAKITSTAEKELQEIEALILKFKGEDK